MNRRFLLFIVVTAISYRFSVSAVFPTGESSSCGGEPFALVDEPLAGGGCRCWTSSTSGGAGAFCCCTGNSIGKSVGQPLWRDDIWRNVTKLVIKRVGGITEIREGDFQFFTSLVQIEIVQSTNLAIVNAEAFAPLKGLKKLSITDCPNLQRVDGYLLRNNKNLLNLEIRRTGLTRMPKLEMLESTLAPPNVDFSENEISELETGDAEHVYLSQLRLSRNRIDRIGEHAFRNSKIFLLRLDNNPLTQLSPDAFAGISALTKLDMSYSELSWLPEDGLGQMEELSVEHVPRLKQLPPLVVFMNLKVARLTYPYHCCLFKFAPTSRKNWKAHTKKYEGNLQELRDKYCHSTATTTSYDPNNQSTTSAHSTPPRPLKRARRQGPNFLGQFGAFYEEEDEELELEEEVQNGFRQNGKKQETSYWGATMYDDIDDYDDGKDNTDGGKAAAEGRVVWEPAPVSVPRIVVPCVDGDRSVDVYYASVKCSPQPDPLNPCEDVMIGWHLRILIFFVWVAAIAGNVLVIVLLLLTNQPRQRVNNFLMINLAFADLCTGVYLAMLGLEDVTTRGQYYNYAVAWQTGWGCKIAGTLAVFASELSIVIMVLISFEDRRRYSLYAVDDSKGVRRLPPSI